MKAIADSTYFWKRQDHSDTVIWVLVVLAAFFLLLLLSEQYRFLTKVVPVATLNAAPLMAAAKSERAVTAQRQTKTPKVNRPVITTRPPALSAGVALGVDQAFTQPAAASNAEATASPMEVQLFVEATSTFYIPQQKLFPVAYPGGGGGGFVQSAPEESPTPPDNNPPPPPPEI